MNFEMPNEFEMSQRPLSAGVAQMVMERTGVEVEPSRQAVTLVRQFGRLQEPETGEVWTYGEAKRGMLNGSVVVVEAELQ